MAISGIRVGDIVASTEPKFEWPAGHQWRVVEDIPNSAYWITDIEIMYEALEDHEGWYKVEAEMEDSVIEVIPRNKYMREIAPGVWVDVYDVLYAFSVTDPCLQHLIKKALATGVRGHKNEREDLIDIRDSAIRAIEHYDAMHPVDK